MKEAGAGYNGRRKRKKGGGKRTMGNYLNPGNSGFTEIRNDAYVDKTGMIRMNRRCEA